MSGTDYKVVDKLTDLPTEYIMHDNFDDVPDEGVYVFMPGTIHEIIAVEIGENDENST